MDPMPPPGFRWAWNVMQITSGMQKRVIYLKEGPQYILQNQHTYFELSYNIDCKLNFFQSNIYTLRLI